jgi:hypothetical protein
MSRRSRKMLTAGAISVLVALSGCDGSASGPEYDPGAPLTVADVEGTWTVSVPRTVACLPNREPFDLKLQLQHSSLAAFVGVEGEEYFNGPWWVEADGERYSLQGWVDMEKRTFRFLLWQGVHEKGSVFAGRFQAGGHLSASLEEPIPPGRGWAADPIPGYPGGFAVGNCAWRVEGQRQSD